MSSQICEREGEFPCGTYWNLTWSQQGVDSECHFYPSSELTRFWRSPTREVTKCDLLSLQHLQFSFLCLFTSFSDLFFPTMGTYRLTHCAFLMFLAILCLARVCMFALCEPRSLHFFLNNTDVSLHFSLRIELSWGRRCVSVVLANWNLSSPFHSPLSFFHREQTYSELLHLVIWIIQPCRKQAFLPTE